MQAHVGALAKRKKKLPEQIIFDVMYESPAVMWSVHDWSTIRLISINALSLLVKKDSYLEAYEKMTRLLVRCAVNT